ncbi:MAG TPA: biliverdin-producing heme oxygenase, partial [Naasia sp.]|jgi:heme oxygenase
MAGMQSLTARLRADNRDLHADIEARVGLPGSVRSRDDYVRLLTRLAAFHAAIEAELDDPRWRSRFTALGVDLAAHRRSALLTQDLAALGAKAPAPGEPIGIAGFEEALGTLYVVEGSTLGGKYLAPQIAEAVPDAPVAFFRSEGRGHPRPWQALKAAVDNFGEAAGDGDRVVEGARRAFGAFGERLASTRWATT